MAISFFGPALIAGAFAVGIALAPAASADELLDCGVSMAECGGSNDADNVADIKPSAAANGYHGSQTPQGWRNDAQWANPDKKGSNPFGAGPRPPMQALD